MLKKLLGLTVLATLASCGKEVMPKPSGDLRLEYPKPRYQTFNSACPFQFDYSDFAVIQDAKKPCWYNINYKGMKAKIFITYLPITSDFQSHLKEVERMVYEHTIKATAIDTKSFAYPEKKVYGNFYELQGQTASNIQFYVTDSTKHFLTGNLYFNTRPKPDSLAPAVDYIKKDMLHLIDTFEWKK